MAATHGGSTDASVIRYRNRISGPLLDRLDLHVDVPSLSFDEISSSVPGERTADVRARVEVARLAQHRRAGCLNARLRPGALRKQVRLAPEARTLLSHAVDRMGLSGRGHDRVIQIALTVRDLAEPDAPAKLPVILGEGHLAEALSYRTLDRTMRALAPSALPAESGAVAERRWR